MHCTTTFHLYLISLHIETKMSCFKGVNALSFFCKLPFNEKKSENSKKKMVLESFSEHITGICSTFFHIKR